MIRPYDRVIGAAHRLRSGVLSPPPWVILVVQLLLYPCTQWRDGAAGEREDGERVEAGGRLRKACSGSAMMMERDGGRGWWLFGGALARASGAFLACLLGG